MSVSPGKQLDLAPETVLRTRKAISQPIQNTRAFAGAPLPRQMGVVSLGVVQAINRMSCWGVRGRFGCARKPPEGSDDPSRNPWPLGQGARQTALQALLARLITEAGERVEGGLVGGLAGGVCAGRAGGVHRSCLSILITG